MNGKGMHDEEVVLYAEQFEKKTMLLRLPKNVHFAK